MFFQRRLRREAADWAATQSWSYQPGGGGPWAEFLPHGKRVRGVRLQLDGTVQGHPVTVAEYAYQTQGINGDTSSRTTTTHHLTVIVVHLAKPHPDLVLRPQALGRVGPGSAKASGFDQRFRVESGLLSPELQQATVEWNLPAWQVRGNFLIIQWQKRVEVADLDRKIEQAVALAALVEPAPR